MKNFEDLLRFWLEEVGPKGWYRSTPELDARIRETFEETWRAAASGKDLGWCMTPRGTLALLILLDQFPRNMFRGSAEAYASDRLARAVAKKAIDRRFDLRIQEPERYFFYMPLMHAECGADQARCIRLIKERMPQTGTDALLHARAHREVIRRFGRFPHRNRDVGRTDSPAEAAFLSSGGYRSVVEGLRPAG